MADKKRVYIEGADIAALTAAARLAKAKYEVFVDGESYQNTIIEGHQFDGGELFTLPAVFRDFFQKTGKHFGQVLEVKGMDPAFVFEFPDLTIRFANLSRNERLSEIESKLGKSAAQEWDALLKNAEYIWEHLRENYVEWEFSYLRANLPVYLRLQIPRIRNPYLQKILAHYATYFGYPTGIYKWSPLVAFVEESFGIWQVKGGTGALVDAIKLRAKELGVTFAPTDHFDYCIDATQVHNRAAQRLLALENYPAELPIRLVKFHRDGLTTDIYSRSEAPGKYALVLTGHLDNWDNSIGSRSLDLPALSDLKKYASVDHFKEAIIGNADDQLITRIRTANKNKFKVRHMDSLAHAGICGELLANAVRGIKNRPSHEH